MFHGSARATECSVEPYSNSQESIRALAGLYGINLKTVAKVKLRIVTNMDHRTICNDYFFGRGGASRGWVHSSGEYSACLLSGGPAGYDPSDFLLRHHPSPDPYLRSCHLWNHQDQSQVDLWRRVRVASLRLRD